MNMRTLISGLLFTFWVVGANAANIDACTVSELIDAIDNAKPGDDIVMCSREWRNLEISFDVEGTAAAPITLRAATPGKSIITGRSQILMAGRYAVIKGLRFQDGYPVHAAVRFRTSSSRVCNNCRLTETSIIDYAPPLGSEDLVSHHEYYVQLHGKNNRVDHNYFTGKNGKGMVLYVEVKSDGPESHRIDHNYFGRRIEHPSGNNGEAIKIGEHTTEFLQSGTVVENNYFYRSNGEFEIISVKASGITLRRNTFDRCEGVLSLRHGNGSWVDANTFLGHRDSSKKVSGIKVSGNDHVITNNYISGINVGTSAARGGITLDSGESTYKEGGRRAAKNVLIAFNTIVDSDRSISVNGAKSVPPSDISIANNLISSSYGPLIAEDMPIDGALYSKNLAFGSSIGVSDSGFIVADPQLVFADGFHRISSTSPARDSANSSYTPISVIGSSATFIDTEGQTRTGAYDIGADEFNLNGAGAGYTRICDTGPRTYSATTSGSCSTSSGPKIPKPPILMSGLN